MKKYEKINNYENLKKFMCPMSGCIIIDDCDFNNELVFTHYKDEKYEINNHYSISHITDFINAL